VVDIVIHHHYKSFSRTVDENHQLWLLAPLGNVVPSFDTGLIKIKDGLCATIKLGLDLRSHLQKENHARTQWGYQISVDCGRYVNVI